jgi:hypothetical protein
MPAFSVIYSLLIAVAITISICPVADAEGSRPICEGMYSRIASVPCGNGTAVIISEFPSPDGRKKIIVKEKPRSQPEMLVRVGKKEHLIEFSSWLCPEFQWAPDSKAFFLTYNDGGAVGNYEVLVYYPSKQGLKVLNPSSFIKKDFLSNYPKCFESETPNFDGVTWLDDSHRLLIAAEVLPHSNCDMMGTFSLYEIEMPSGKILKKYGQLESKRIFDNILGVELRKADDRCITEPGSCNNPQLHEERKQ